jgi:molybdate transport system regulatory protein
MSARPSRSSARATRPRGTVAPRLKVWVVFGGRVKFGDGRAELLQLVDELGSLHQAVARVGMSYRNAWGYLRELERAAGFRLLEPVPGGGRRGGMRLTAEGRAFLARYRRFRAGLDPAVQRHFTRSFARR